MDRLTSMAVFVKAADLGSFAKAAAALNLSPQMVAKHVLSLEDRLGMTLLNRTTRRQSLTDIGRAYYDRCKLVLAEAEAADGLANEMRKTPRGILRIGAGKTFGAFALAPFLKNWLSEHPSVEADLVLEDRYTDPLDEGLDVIIRIGELADTNLIAHPLAPYRLITCASPAYLAEHGTPVHPSDLESHQCLGFASWSRTFGCEWTFAKDGRTQTINVQGRLRSNDWAALLNAAVAGMGITLGPERVLSAELTSGRLVRVLPDYDGPAKPVHLLYPASRRPAAALRAFIEAAVREFGDPRSTRQKPSRTGT